MVTATTTTYSLRSKAGHQRKHRVFAVYEVANTPRGTFADVTYYDYKTQRRDGFHMVDPSVIGPAVVRHLAHPGCSVQYTHYEDAS